MIINEELFIDKADFEKLQLENKKLHHCIIDYQMTVSNLVEINKESDLFREHYIKILHSIPNITEEQKEFINNSLTLKHYAQNEK